MANLIKTQAMKKTVLITGGTRGIGFELAKIFAKENRTTVADIVTQYMLTLKRKVEGESAEKILAHPAFQKGNLRTQHHRCG